MKQMVALNCCQEDITRIGEEVDTYLRRIDGVDARVTRLATSSQKREKEDGKTERYEGGLGGEKERERERARAREGSS